MWKRVGVGALLCWLVAGVLWLTVGVAVAEGQAAGGRGRGRARERAVSASSVLPVRDATIARIVREIDARNIERSIRTLVSFGTRNTLSAQDNPARGIGAARDWLYAEFSRIAEQSGGRMTVEKQSYLQEAQPPPRGRVP